VVSDLLVEGPHQDEVVPCVRLMFMRDRSRPARHQCERAKHTGEPKSTRPASPPLVEKNRLPRGLSHG